MSRATVESTIIVVRIVSVLSVLALRDDLAANATGLGTVGQSLVAVHDATFLLGPAFCAGVGNGALLGYLMYTSGLVPRRMALLGLAGHLPDRQGLQGGVAGPRQGRQGALEEAFSPAAAAG